MTVETSTKFHTVTQYVTPRDAFVHLVTDALKNNGVESIGSYQGVDDVTVSGQKDGKPIAVTSSNREIRVNSRPEQMISLVAIRVKKALGSRGDE